MILSNEYSTLHCSKFADYSPHSDFFPLGTVPGLQFVHREAPEVLMVNSPHSVHVSMLESLYVPAAQTT